MVRFMPFARQLAARYRHAGEPLEDLVQVAYVGLIKAVDRYDPDRGNGLRATVPTMLGEIKRHFRDKGWSIHVPRATQELVLRVGEALGALPASSAGRRRRATSPPPCRARGGRARGDGGGHRLRGRVARCPRPGNGEEEAWTLAESLAEEEHGYELVEIGETLRGTLEALPARERLILRLRFEEDLTQAEIAEYVGSPDARFATAAPLARPALRSGRGSGVAWVSGAGLTSRPEVAALVVRAEERGCVNLSEFDELAGTDARLGDDEVDALEAQLEAHGIDVADDCGRPERRADPFRKGSWRPRPTRCSSSSTRSAAIRS